MTEPREAKRGWELVGFGAAACVACCAGPILAFLGGLSIAGIASTWFIGISGLAIAAVAAVAYLAVRRRRQQAACGTRNKQRVAVPLTTKADP